MSGDICSVVIYSHFHAPSFRSVLSGDDTNIIVEFLLKISEAEHKSPTGMFFFKDKLLLLKNGCPSPHLFLVFSSPSGGSFLIK